MVFTIKYTQIAYNNFVTLQASSYLFILKVRVAFLELYKETLYDLLSAKGRKEDCSVDLREDPKAGVKIVNLTEVSIPSELTLNTYGFYISVGKLSTIPQTDIHII